MKYLLDTCTFLWIASCPERIPEAVAKLLQSDDASIYLSVASSWEIGLKYGLGKLSLPELPQKVCASLAIPVWGGKFAY